MPELPEVETIARKLRPLMLGRAITGVDVLWERTIDRPAPATFCQRLTGARVTEVGRRGKFLVFTLDRGLTWLVHLRMSGKFEHRPPAAGPGEHRHLRARLALDDGAWLLFINQRKFGRFYLVEDAQEVVGQLGIEPLAPEFTAAWLAEALRGRRGEIKRLLLDQHVIAGLGNIYASEALWQARIHPQRVAGSLTEAEMTRLQRAIVECLRAALDHGGTSLADQQYVYPDGNLGQYQEYLRIYDRAAEQCPRCGYTVARIVQGQRSTFFCPVCQPLLDWQ